MRKFHIKSIVLGIGVGIVLAAFMSIIYLGGNQPTLSKEEVIERAKQYGMVFSEDTILTNSANDTKDKQ
jgi:flagellar basal body-associated protein FliL